MHITQCSVHTVSLLMCGRVDFFRRYLSRFLFSHRIWRERLDAWSADRKWRRGDKAMRQTDPLAGFPDSFSLISLLRFSFLLTSLLSVAVSRMHERMRSRSSHISSTGQLWERVKIIRILFSVSVKRLQSVHLTPKFSESYSAASLASCFYISIYLLDDDDDCYYFLNPGQSSGCCKNYSLEENWSGTAISPAGPQHKNCH